MMEKTVCHGCGSDRSRETFRQRDLTAGTPGEEFPVMRCLDCGLLFLSPRPTLREIAQYYPARYFGPPSRPRPPSRVKRWILEDYYGYPSRHPPSVGRRFRKLLLFPEWLRRVAQGREAVPYVGTGRLLDVGCGPGVNVRSFQEQGWKAFGLEPSLEAVKLARRVVGSRVVVGTVEAAPFKESTFDMIVFSHSLEHFFNPADALAHTHRLLKPDGLLLVVVPNAGSWEAKLFGRHWIQWDVPRHLYHFERQTLRRLLERSGFSLRRMRTGVGTAFFLGSLERVWRHVFHGSLPARKLLKRLIAGPFCFLAGHLRRGAEVIVYAAKREG